MPRFCMKVLDRLTELVSELLGMDSLADGVREHRGVSSGLTARPTRKCGAGVDPA